jgi:hypothetical protein
MAKLDWRRARTFREREDVRHPGRLERRADRWLAAVEKRRKAAARVRHRRRSNSDEGGRRQDRSASDGGLMSSSTERMRRLRDLRRRHLVTKLVDVICWRSRRSSNLSDAQLNDDRELRRILSELRATSSEEGGVGFGRRIPFFPCGNLRAPRQCGYPHRGFESHPLRQKAN